MARFIWFLAFFSILIISTNCENHKEADEYYDGNEALSSDQVEHLQRKIGVKCPDGWHLFNRSTGVNWCMKVFREDVNQDLAKLKCAFFKAKLSGIQTIEERKYIEKEGYQLFQNDTTKEGSVWIGAEWKTACRIPEWRDEEYCTNFRGIEWTDGVTTGDEGFRWASGQPNQNYEHCVGLSIYRNLGPNGLPLSDDDDMVCKSSGQRGGRWNVHGYVCGKKAQ